jgi:hypothetical protein
MNGLSVYPELANRIAQPRYTPREIFVLLQQLGNAFHRGSGLFKSFRCDHCLLQLFGSQGSVWRSGAQHIQKQVAHASHFRADCGLLLFRFAVLPHYPAHYGVLFLFTHKG